MSEYPNGTEERSGHDQESRNTPQQTGSAVGEMVGTAKGQAQAMAGEARQQTHHVVDQLRDRVGDQTRQQSRRAAQGIRRWADDLASMGEGAEPDSQVSGVVRQVADQGRRAADYLDQNGLNGVAQEIQNFARRRPGAFLAGVAAAGFLIGRIAKASGGTTSRGSPGTGGDGSYAPDVPAPGPAATMPPIPEQPMPPPPSSAEPYRTRPVTAQGPPEEYDGFGTPATPGNPGGEIR
ncbi:hypothetical protein [Streptosporangium sp. NPDC002721]|uniref:hypothetical protein n=1 Tax=Streptosporangium sp. NPDC002721 TaxID=3366188 RepID=UPI0036AC353B